MTSKYDVPIEQLRNTLHYDPFTGKIYKKIFDETGRATELKEAFTTYRLGYLNGSHLGYTYDAHRIAWALYYGAWPEKEIDHWNGDRADNRIRNLRDVSHLENSRNRHPGMYPKRNTKVRVPPQVRADGALVAPNRKIAPIRSHEVLSEPVVPPTPGLSGVRGVYFNKGTGKWMARIKINKKWIYLGLHADLENAVKARRTAEEFYARPR